MGVCIFLLKNVSYSEQPAAPAVLLQRSAEDKIMTIMFGKGVVMTQMSHKSETDKIGLRAVYNGKAGIVDCSKKCDSRNDNIYQRKINKHYTFSAQKQPLCSKPCCQKWTNMFQDKFCVFLAVHLLMP